MKPARFSRFALPAVVGASAAAAFLVYRYLVAPGGALSWDESAHALYGLLIADDIRRHDWVGLLYDTYRQVYWPPLHSWLAGLLFLFTGPRDAAARAVSAVCMAALPPVLFLAARRMTPQHGTTAGLITASLALTSPAVIAYSSRGLLEMPGLVAVAFALYAWFRATEKEARRRWHVLAGLGLLAAFFAKTNYGIILGLALVAAQITGAGTGIRNLFTRRYAYTFLPVVLALAVWFAYPAKIQETWRTLVNQPWGETDTYGAAGLLFYPRAFVQLSGSIWLALAYLACLLAALRRWRQPQVRLLVILVAIQFFIGELHHTKLARHLLPVYPALFLLAGRAGAAAWRGATLRGGAAWRWAARGALVALVLHGGALARRTEPPRFQQIDPSVTRELGSLLRQPGGGLAVISWRFPCPLCLDWLLVSREWALDPLQAGSVAQPEQSSRLATAVSRRLSPGLLQAVLHRVSTRYAEAGKSRTYYSAARAPSALLTGLIKRGDFDWLAVLSLDSHSPDPLPAALDPLVRAASLKAVSSSYLRSLARPAASGKTQPVILRLDTYRR